MRYAYDQACSPPAPVVLLTIRLPERGEQELRVNVLVDTGADMSVVPPTLVGTLGALPAGEHTIQGIGGASIEDVPAYFLEFELDGHRDLVEGIACGDRIIAGRNWLNSFHITLDGPQETLSIKARSNARGET